MANKIEVVYHRDGCQGVGFDIWKETNLIPAVGIASNSGRPGGSCGSTSGVEHRKIHSYHRTHEEDVVSSWLYFMTTKEREVAYSEIANKWGMKIPLTDNSMTLQGVDYKHTENPADYHFAWAVKNVELYSKEKSKFVKTRKFPANLIFIAGPNTKNGRTQHGSMSMTKNKKACAEYDFFCNCIRHALFAFFLKCIEVGSKIPLVPRISTGLYAGPHKDKIQDDFDGIVQSVLIKERYDGIPLIDFFDKVIIPVKGFC